MDVFKGHLSEACTIKIQFLANQLFLHASLRTAEPNPAAYDLIIVCGNLLTAESSLAYDPSL